MTQKDLDFSRLCLSSNVEGVIAFFSGERDKNDAFYVNKVLTCFGPEDALKILRASKAPSLTPVAPWLSLLGVDTETLKGVLPLLPHKDVAEALVQQDQFLLLNDIFTHLNAEASLYALSLPKMAPVLTKKSLFPHVARFYAVASQRARMTDELKIASKSQEKVLSRL